MSSKKAISARFKATLHQAEGKKATGIVIPDPILEQLRGCEEIPASARGRASCIPGKKRRRGPASGADDAVSMEGYCEEAPRSRAQPQPAEASWISSRPLRAGRRPSVRVTVNGYAYRTTAGVMGGRAMVGVSAAIRKETGLAAGDRVDVELVVDASPRKIDVPADFARALAANPSVRPFFDGLSSSLQRYHVGRIETAKADETRRRRIAKAVALFRAGKKR
jgi:hypothetical protein